MNKKIDLSSIKENESILVGFAMVVLALILGVALFLTFKETVAIKDSINTTINTANANKEHIINLRKIKADQEKYKRQEVAYDANIASPDTYDTLQKQIELEDMLVKYNLTGTAKAGELTSYAGVQKAESTVEVIGKESDVKAMCLELLSPDYIVRIDSFQIADNADGTVTAAFTVVNFTK